MAYTIPVPGYDARHQGKGKGESAYRGQKNPDYEHPGRVMAYTIPGNYPCHQGEGEGESAHRGQKNPDDKQGPGCGERMQQERGHHLRDFLHMYHIHKNWHESRCYITKVLILYDTVETSLCNVQCCRNGYNTVL